MKNFFLVFVTAVAICSCNNDKKENAGTTPETKVEAKIDSMLITDSSWGAVTAKTDFAALQNIFGTTNVKDERICGPECIDSIDVTIIYPETNKEIIIHWKDSFYHKKIVYLESYREGCPYHTSAGLKAGSILKELLALNGKKITFAGFGWDYGGYIHSYNGGTLDSSSVSFRLDLMENASDSLFGDTELNTDMPVVQKVLDKIRVYQVSLSFYKEPL